MANGTDAALTAEQLATGGNRLLAASQPVDLAFLAGCSRRVRFTRDEVLWRAHAEGQPSLFVESGVASTLKLGAGERRTEICLIGCEAMIGAALVLADGRSPYDTFVQLGELTAIRTEGDDLRALFGASEAFRSILLRAVHLEMVQVAEGLVSAAGQQIAARLARWLLMYRDRLGTARIEVTHEVMALTVGAQRARITAALHELESDGAIRAGRGHVVIRDIERLEVFADSGYGTPEREEQRLFARRPDA